MDLTRVRDRHDRRSFDRWIALALAAFGVVEVGVVLDEPELVPATVVMAATVALRRSRPLAAVAVFVAAYLSQMPLAGDELIRWALAQALPFFLLGFSLAAHEERAATAVAGALLLVAGFWTDAVRVGAPAGDYIAPVVGVTVCWSAGRLLYRERGLARALAEANVRLEHAAAAEERARIARELHDIVGHSLTAIAVQADAAQAAFDVEPARTRKALERIDRTARQALEDVRRVVAGLREEGGEPAPSLAGLEPLVEEARAAGTPVDLRVEGSLELPQAVDASAYRIVQEALTNVRRHAPGAPVELALHRHDGVLELRIANPAPGGAATRSGHGLVGARERVRALGGTIRAGRDGSGIWRVEATLPVDRR